MIGKKEIKMKRIASVSFFGIALALALSFGIPGNANAFDNGTSGRIILAGVEAGFDVFGVGAGVGIGNGGVDAGAHVGGAGAGVDIGGSDGAGMSANGPMNESVLLLTNVLLPISVLKSVLLLTSALPIKRVMLIATGKILALRTQKAPAGKSG